MSFFLKSMRHDCRKPFGGCLVVAMLLAGAAQAQIVLNEDFNGSPVGTLVGFANYTGGFVQLTDNSGGDTGTWIYDPGAAMPAFQFKTDVFIGGGSGADGFSFSYSELDGSAIGVEGDDTPGLVVVLDTYDNGGGDFVGIDVRYNSVQVASVTLSDATLEVGGFVPFEVDVATSGAITVQYNGTQHISSTIPSWNPQSTWRIGLGANTGGLADFHAAEDVRLRSAQGQVVSINRLDTNPVLGGTPSVDYRVSFTEPVNNLDAGDFTVSTVSGTASAAVSSVSGPQLNISETFTGGAGVGTLLGNAAVSGGVLHLTDAVNSQNGSWYYAPPQAAKGFRATFDLLIGGGGGADGFSFAYGENAGALFGHEGPTGNGVVVAFDTYDNGSENTPNITIKYNGVDQVEEYKPGGIRTATFVPVVVIVTTTGLCSVYHDGTAVAHTVLSGWNPQSTWEFGFGAATGGVNDNHWVDNFTVQSNAYDVTLDTLSGSGNLRLDVSGASNITDVFGSALSPVAFTSGQTYTIDTVAPTAVCTNPTVQLSASGSVIVPVASIDGGSSDDVGITLSTIDSSATKSFTCSDIGPQNVTLRVQDAAGNFDTCIATVTVQDSISPTVSCPGSASVNADPGVCTGTVPNVISGILAGDVDDNCTADGSLLASLAQSPIAGTTGATDGQLITVTVTDGSGNTGQCTVTLDVNDTQLPTFIGLTNPSVSADTGVCTGTVPNVIALLNGSNVADNCTNDSNLLASLSQSPTAGTAGVSDGATITLTVTDDAGNMNSANVTLNVTDDEAPVVTPNAGASTAVGIGASFSDPGATASDNCGVSGGTTIASGTCISGDCSFDTSTPLNSWTIEYTASDINGNGPVTATTVFTVNADTTNPVFSNLQVTPSPVLQGEDIAITFTSSEALVADPVVLVNGDAATYVGSAKATVDYEYSYTIPTNATPGPATIEITGLDNATNVGSLTNNAAFVIEAIEASVPLAAWPLVLTLGIAAAGVFRKRKK